MRSFRLRPTKTADIIGAVLLVCFLAILWWLLDAPWEASRARARTAERVQEIRTLGLALAQYRLDTRALPPELNVLRAAVPYAVPSDLSWVEYDPSGLPWARDKHWVLAGAAPLGSDQVIVGQVGGLVEVLAKQVVQFRQER